ncbi:YkgJ family cysteine cluster protein [Sandaracinus amylolyticus]|uniref:YkgJ family cysteine cluster protein n=1 Tax=Sandaracinus amylolyticus TaxID=927083 RepID=UPI001F1BCF49|nr:YkgJ family cysteine cluster protein [Sandaracinus amylolyticus]UJR82022.1 Zinc/iron-chelating domain-containing protein [Sandaracinus amylolyticus]
MNDPLAAHRALVAKVDAFEGAVRARRDASMACRAGCSACCHAELSVCDVEAALVREGLAVLDDAARAHIAERVDVHDGRCVMLDHEGRCAIYDARPLVCRTQGLPLRYPDGVIPEAAIMARGKGANGGALTWCPLNFQGDDHAPRAEDVLDAERVDAMLALSNREHGGDPSRRTSLRALAREITAELNEGNALC